MLRIMNRKLTYLLFSLYLANLSLAYADEVTGEVYDVNTNRPLYKATVSCSKDPYKQQIVGRTLTDKMGRYQLNNVPSGVYYVTAEMVPKYDALTSYEEIKGHAKKNFPLAELPRYSLRSAEVVSVNFKASTVIVKDMKGKQVKLSVSSNTNINIGKMKITLKDVQIGNQISAEYYGTSKQQGNVAIMDIEKAPKYGVPPIQ